MRVGNSKVDFKALLIDGPTGVHTIEPKIMKLLKVLVENAGEVMSREELITAVWGVEYGGDERLSRAISIIRKALGDERGHHTHIVTISRTGYRLIADISEGDNAQISVSRRATSHDHAAHQPLTMQSDTVQLATSGSHAAATETAPKRLALAALLIVGALFLSLVAFSTMRSDNTMSLEAKLENGFYNVENFAAKGAIKDAQETFSSILAADPDHAAARAGLAFSIFREYTHLEHDPALLQRAKAHAEAALRNDEHLALANIAVAWAAEYEGDFDRSHQLLDRASILDVDNMFAFEGRFRTYGKQGEFSKAEDVIEVAISTYPNRALFYTKRGDFHARKDEFKSAESDFRRAISLFPDNPRTYAQLAHSLHMQGQTEKAVEAIQRGLTISETALLYSNLGTYLFFQGQYDLAASAFEKTLDLSGDTHDYLYWANLGDAFRWSENKKDEAAVAYKRALQLLQVGLNKNPKDANLKSRAALFNAKLGDLDKVQTYMDSFELTPSSPSIQLYRAVVTYEIMSNRKKALEFLEAAIRSNYPLTEILNDPELAQLRQDPSYHRLLAKLQN